jgi:5-methylcytosine-specific restriction endonuclease McrA
MIQTITNEGEFTLKFPKNPRKVDKTALREYRQQHPYCELCGSSDPMGANRGGIHHRKPRSRGGSDVPENLITLCGRCHTAVHAGRITL